MNRLVNLLVISAIVAAVMASFGYLDLELQALVG